MGKIGFKLNENRCDDSKQKSIMKCDFQHAICIGNTGSGKTASLILPTLEDRIKKNHAVIVYIYKGHEHRKIKHLAVESNRINDVIEIGKPHGKYINLMSLLELDMVKHTLVLLSGGLNGDKLDFWTLSASRLGTAIVDILRKIHMINVLLEPVDKEKKSFREVSFKLELPDEFESVHYTYPKDEPSYKTLAQITSNPKKLLIFLQGLKALVRNIEMRLKLITIAKKSESSDNILIVEVVKHLLRLEKAYEGYIDFGVDDKSGEAGGNNGVLQVLNNAIASLANKDYINTQEVDVLDLIEKKSILIVDIEGLNLDVHGVMLESILNKLGRRIRNGTPNPVSIFVDEANRVLPSNVDLHNDVLRESKVELIMAIQNEEQMIEKFNRIKWLSIKKNFKHNYFIDTDHRIMYNHKDEWLSKPLLIDDNQLNDAEYIYNNLIQNKILLEERFSITEMLPERYAISYDITSYEQDMLITLTNDEGYKTNIEYIGKEMKEKIKNKMSALNVDEFTIEVKSKPSLSKHNKSKN